MERRCDRDESVCGCFDERDGRNRHRIEHADCWNADRCLQSVEYRARRCCRGDPAFSIQLASACGWTRWKKCSGTNCCRRCEAEETEVVISGKGAFSWFCRLRCAVGIG